MLHSLIPATTRIFGSVPMVRYDSLSFDTTGIGSGLKLCTLRASVSRPMLVETMMEVVTAFDAATSNVLTVGTTIAATELLASGDITEGTPGFYPSGAGVGKKRITANTDIYVKLTGALAVGTLTSGASGAVDVTAGDTVTIGSTTYTFRAAVALNNEVKVSGTADGSLLNLIRAINNSGGTAGTDYSVSAANPDVTAATSVTSHAFVVTAKNNGTGAAVATTETAATLSWGGTTLASGSVASQGAAKLYTKVTPLYQGT